MGMGHIGQTSLNQGYFTRQATLQQIFGPVELRIRKPVRELRREVA